MEVFEKLGESIEDRWRRENYSEKLFPEIAAQALSESDLPSRVDPWDIIRWVHTSPTLPEQKDVDAAFGNPPITLFSGSRFYIDVYYWLDGTTTIHQHAFCGAFQVLLGSSIHSHYEFREDRILSEHFSVGELTLRSVQLLKLGDIKQILPGRDYVHSLFHLDRPSSTITIRTEHTPSAALQYDYRKPYFAVNPFFRNVSTIKKVQTVNLLLGMKHKDADAMISDCVVSSDFHTAYLVLSAVAQHLKGGQIDQLFGLTTGADRFATILEKARAVHGDLIDKFEAVLAETERQQNLIMRRGGITGEDHRFFLALLLNVPDRKRIFDLVQQRFPEDDAVEKILDWVEELSQTRVLGSNEPNALGIQGFNHEFLFAFETLLKNDSIIPNTKEKIQEASEREGTDRQEITEKLRNSPIFKSILSTSV